MLRGFLFLFIFETEPGSLESIYIAYPSGFAIHRDLRYVIKCLGGERSYVDSRSQNILRFLLPLHQFTKY